MSTAGAFIDVAAESGGATACDGEQDLDMGPADPPAVALDERGSCGAGQIGHLQRGAAHLFLRFWTAVLHPRVQRAGGGGGGGLGEGGSEGGVFFVGVKHKG